MKNDNVEEKVKKKSSNKKIFRALSLGFGAICIIIGAYLIITTYYKSLNNITYRHHTLYQYIDGHKFEYEGEFSLTREDEITSLKSNDIIIEDNTFPIYYDYDPDLVLFPIDMGLILLDDIYSSYKMNHFSEIQFNKEQGNATLQYANKNIFLGESFAYDGADLYFFIYPTKVTFDDKEYNLDSGSYAIVKYKGQIDIYDRANDNYNIIEYSDSNVIAEISNYKINMSTDMVLTEKGNRLLIKNNSKLPVYEGIKKGK